MTPPDKRFVVAAAVLAVLASVVGIAIHLAFARPRIHPSGSVYTPAGAPSAWHGTQDSLGHAAHVRGVRPVACADCHEIAQGTFQRPDASRCAKCHPDTHPTLHRNAPPET